MSIEKIKEYRELFIKQFENLLKIRDEADSHIEDIYRVIGASDDFIAKYYKGLALAIDNFIDTTYFMINNLLYNPEIPFETIQEDIDYLYYEGGGTIEVNDKQYQIDTPQDIWNMWIDCMDIYYELKNTYKIK